FGGSAEIPKITAPAFCSFLYDSRNPRASMVQPGVSALGKKNRTTFLPRKSLSETSCPFSSGKVNSGALSLVFMATPLRTWLYRRAGLAVICLVIGLSSVTVLRAQYGKKGTQSKGPRALGLLEMYSSGQTRLRPICIMIDGRFYDAGIYKADPVPMALETGTVYEAERNGESQGLFTIKNVLQNEAKKTFVAEGTWLPVGAEAPKSTSMKAETKPKEEEDEKPPVRRRPGSEPPKQENPKPAENKPSSTSTQPDDDDRPRLHKPANDANPTATSSTATSSPAESNPPRAGDTNENDPNRPHLRRGLPSSPSKSAAAPAPSDQPAGTKSPKAGDQKNSSVSTSAKNETQLLPAISDAGGPEPRPYTYDVTPKEMEGFRNKVLALAGQDLVKQAKQLEPDLTATPAPRSVRTGKAST